MSALLEKAAFKKALEEKLGRREQGWLFLVDLDGLRRVNDVYGIPAADLLLRKLWANAESLLPKQGLLGRLGGDELAVFVRGGDEKEARAFAESLRAAVSKIRFDAREAELTGDEDGQRQLLGERFSAGIGAARTKPNSRLLGDLRFPAFHALREAKRGGRDQLRISPGERKPSEPAPVVQFGGATRPLPETSAFGWNLAHRWFEGWEEGGRTLALPDGTPLRLDWRLCGLGGTPPGYLVNCSVAGKPLPVDERLTMIDTGNGGTSTSFVETRDQQEGCGTLLIEPLKKGAPLRWKDVGPSQWELSLAIQNSGAIYNTVVHLGQRLSLTVDLRYGVVRIENTESMDDRT